MYPNKMVPRNQTVNPCWPRQQFTFLSKLRSLEELFCLKSRQLIIIQNVHLYRLRSPARPSCCDVEAGRPGGPGGPWSPTGPLSP